MAGIAAINLIGNLTGFSDPYATEILKDATGKFDMGLTLIAGLAFAAVILVGGGQVKGSTALAASS